jgi:hypothetical protein
VLHNAAGAGRGVQTSSPRTCRCGPLMPPGLPPNRASTSLANTSPLCRRAQSCEPPRSTRARRTRPPGSRRSIPVIRGCNLSSRFATRSRNAMPPRSGQKEIAMIRFVVGAVLIAGVVALRRIRRRRKT